MRASLSVLACLALLACAGPEPASNAGQEGATGVVDPLPSWNDGPARSAVLDFVARVTTPGSPDFVPEAERVAVFDNDGTLWAEQPLYFQLAFAIDRARELAAADPELAENALLKALIESGHLSFPSGKLLPYWYDLVYKAVGEK